MLPLLLAVLVPTAFATGCGHDACPSQRPPPTRDFAAYPVVVEQATYTTLYALSDVHGGYDRMVHLLARHGLIAPSPTAPDAVVWTGGDATLVVTGDLIDKGSRGVEVIDLMRALAVSASVVGGHVVVTLGNHEAEFLVDPRNDKAGAFEDELAGAKIDACRVGDGSDAHGAWLRGLPLAARVGGWFFAHAGNTKGRTVPELEMTLQMALALHDYDDPEIVGSDSLLEARSWWEATAGLAKANATQLGARHIVFGHTPSALGPTGAIAVAEDGVLFRIDTGMSPAVDDSEGALLRVTHDGDSEVATELRADGTARELWRGPGG